MSLVGQAWSARVACLLAPIDAQTPAGLFDVEDETYQAIDQEMVKLGGLHEASIDWPYIEEASCQYLKDQCKQLRVVGHLSVAWLRGGGWEHWCLTLELLAGMVERYWESAHPKPGPMGYLGKRRLVHGVLKRLADALPRLDRFSYTPALGAAAEQAIACLHEQLGSAKLDPECLAGLQRLLLERTREAAGATPAEQIQAAAPNVPPPLEQALLPSKPVVSLGNERETRRATLSMAEYINQQDLYDPTGYQLRRFGLWAHIQAAPAAREQRTELMAVPVDILAGYEEAIAATVIDPAVLLRIERSVAASPYWFRGSYLAATVATRLAMGEVAEAIRSATARFVQRLPALRQLCFSDGTAFVDEQCMAWVKGVNAQPSREAPVREFSQLRAGLSEQLEAQGIEAVLLALQGQQANQTSPRDRSHLTLIAADLLAARGVSWLAQDLCASVAQTMQQTSADVWEPETFRRLQHYAATSLLIDRTKDQRLS